MIGLAESQSEIENEPQENLMPENIVYENEKPLVTPELEYVDVIYKTK